MQQTVETRAEPEGVRVAVMNVRRVMDFVDNPRLAEVAQQVDARLQRVLESLAA